MRRPVRMVPLLPVLVLLMQAGAFAWLVLVVLGRPQLVLAVLPLLLCAAAYVLVGRRGHT